MFEAIPIIGLVGGIGSGKSRVAGLLGELGCAVIDSDAQARAALSRPETVETLRQWWGAGIVNLQGQIDRSAIARRVFDDPAQRLRLEALIHPLVARQRDREMAEALERARRGESPRPLAFVWDTPLLFEAGLADACDAILFVDAPLADRQERVMRSRGWSASELGRREAAQWPLDKKRRLADDALANPNGARDERGEPAGLRNQARQALSRIFAGLSRPPAL